LPTKTRPKKLSLLGSDGRLHTLLFKGSEDLRMDQRVMQLVAHVNGLLARRVRYCDGLRGRVYAVVPVAARSGLIQWVSNATPLFSLYRV
jgi:PI-3-kinase-related kinase SMG-1